MHDNRVRFTLRIPSDLLEQIGERATNEGFSMNSKILQIIYDWVRQTDAKEG